MFENKDEDGLYECQLHDGKISPINWITSNQTKSIPDINFFFWAKHENRGKIESHLWYYKAFCCFINPQYCQIIDIGTIPLKNSISRIWIYMEKFKQVGGAWGEIEVFNPTDKELGYPIEKKDENQNVTLIKRGLWDKIEGFVIVYAQYVEYKISHYLDKSFESLFGFVSVLPGAFCTLR